jgi:hypothetical protein
MTKYEPNFFVPCDKLRNTSISPVLCKDEPLEAGVLAMDFLNEFLSREQKDIVVLDQNKAQIFPGKLQEKVKIIALSRETLILKVKANSSVWRAEIAAMKTNIMVACNKILGRVAVKSVSFYIITPGGF